MAIVELTNESVALGAPDKLQQLLVLLHVQEIQLILCSLEPSMIKR